MPDPSLTLGPQSIGTDRSYRIGPLKDGTGATLVSTISLTGTEPVACSIWHGEDGTSIVAPIGAVSSTSLGYVTITVTAANTTTIALPGTYRIAATITISGQVLDILPSDAVFVLADAAGTPTRTTTFTRAKAEKMLLRRCGRLLRWANLDGSTDTGGNADLADPIAVSLRACGVYPSDPINPADADLALVVAADYDKFFGVAELRCLESIWGNLDEVTEQEGTDKQDWNQAKAELRKRIADLRKALEDQFGYGGGSLEPGTFILAWTEPEEE